ncbi:MAG: LLM class flavin-dependent oxidoreductase [Rhodospirillaceae bacterium]|nr:LLM class flavin-dependent oxidoreductase [Rhodospirillaceae bacterium]
MQLALFMMPVHDCNRDYHTTLMEDVEAVIHADKLGYSEVWVGEHYASASEQITSPLLFLSHLLPRTEQIVCATGVICLPQYHPALTAGQIAMFDHLAKGRFIMGLGPGGLPPDFELFDIMDKDRNAMMVEAIDMMIEIWANDPPYRIKGEHWNVTTGDWVYDDIGLGRMCKPYQKPHPPIAISAMSPSSGSIKFAGSRGYIPLSANFIGTWSVKTHWEVYAEAASKAGHPTDPEIWRVARNIHVDETDAAAEEFVKALGQSTDWYFDYLYKIFERADMKTPFVINQNDDPAELTARDLRDNYTIHGSPDTVVEKIMELREQVGHFGTLAATAQDWTDKPRMKRSMELLAKEVMPKVNSIIGSRDAAD